MNTTQLVTSVRVNIDNEYANTASMTAHAVAYHVRPENTMKLEHTSYVCILSIWTKRRILQAGKLMAMGIEMICGGRAECLR